MNAAAYSLNSNPYSQNANYGSFGYNNPTLVGGSRSLTPADTYLPQGPQDSVVLSGGGNRNFNFGVQDVCDCQFGNGTSQEAFIVPAGDQDNPYQNYNATAMELPGVDGQNPQQTLMALLANLGITPEMLQQLQSMGINLLDLIAEANGMECLNGLQTGQDMVLPTTIPANSEAPSVVYMPAAQSSGTHHSAPKKNHHQAAPAAAPAPARREANPYEGETYVGGGRRIR